MIGGHNWGGGKIYAGRGGHSTYIVDGGNNWVGDTAQHSKMELSVAKAQNYIPGRGALQKKPVYWKGRTPHITS